MVSQIGKGFTFVLLVSCYGCTTPRSGDSTAQDAGPTIEHLRAENVRISEEVVRLKAEVAVLEEVRRSVDGERRTIQEALIRCSANLSGSTGIEARERAARDERLVQAQEKTAQAQESAVQSEATREKRQRALDQCLADARATRQSPESACPPWAIDERMKRSW